MANVIKGSSEVKVKRSAPQNPNGSFKSVLVLLIISALLIFLYFKTEFLPLLIFAFVAVAVAIIRIVFSFSVKKESNGFTVPVSEQERYGAIGELKTEILLEQLLPADYTVIRNVKVTYDGKTSEIDNVVIGNTGVYIIEVKTMKGTVYADYDAHDWKKVKTDKYGIEHEKDFYSPVKQVGTHVYRLANVLRRSGIRAYVNAIVYFSDPEANVIISGEKNNIPIFDFKKRIEMRDFICNNPPVLSSSSIKKAINLLTSNTL